MKKWYLILLKISVKVCFLQIEEKRQVRCFCIQSHQIINYDSKKNTLLLVWRRKKR